MCALCVLFRACRRPTRADPTRSSSSLSLTAQRVQCGRRVCLSLEAAAACCFDCGLSSVTAFRLLSFNCCSCRCRCRCLAASRITHCTQATLSTISLATRPAHTRNKLKPTTHALTKDQQKREKERKQSNDNDTISRSRISSSSSSQ